MAPQNIRPFAHINSTVIKILVILAQINDSASTDVYRVAKNTHNVKLCVNATKPDKVIKFVKSLILCSGECSLEETCAGFNYRPNRRICELFNQPGTMKFDIEEGCSSYYKLQNPNDVGNTEVAQPCSVGMSGHNCSFPFTYNGQLLKQCVNFSLYNVTGFHCLTGNRSVIKCDSCDTGCSGENISMDITIPTIEIPTLAYLICGWITIHQKLNDSLDFNLYWADYKAGFGNPGGNFWIGLERMHQMTSTTPYRLRVEVQSNCTRLWYSAEYDMFLIDSEASGYAIHVTGYHGDAGDAIQYANVNIYQNGMKFSTRDVDNDYYSAASCAVIYRGGNWHNACFDFLLTGSGSYHRWNTMSCGVLSASRMMIKTF